MPVDTFLGEGVTVVVVNICVDVFMRCKKSVTTVSFFFQPCYLLVWGRESETGNATVPAPLEALFPSGGMYATFIAKLANASTPGWTL